MIISQIVVDRLDLREYFKYPERQKSSKKDFWTQISLLQGFSISTYTDQNGLKIDETWLKSNFVSLFMVICDSEIFLSRSKKNQFLVFFCQYFVDSRHLWAYPIWSNMPLKATNDGFWTPRTFHNTCMYILRHLESFSQNQNSNIFYPQMACTILVMF